VSEVDAITTVTQQIAGWEKSKDAVSLLDCAIVEGGVLERAACDSLQRLGKKALTACRATISDETVQPFHRFSAARIFGVIAGKAETAELLKMMDHEQIAVRRGAAEGLGYHVQGAKAVERLAQALESDDPPLRRAATQALQALKATKKLADIVPLLADRAPSVRRAAALAVGSLGGTKGIEELTERIHDRDRSVRRALAQALAGVGAPETAPALMKLSQDEAVDIRHEAVRALGKLLPGPADVEDRLIDALDDRAPQVRRAAAQILGEHKVLRAVQHLCDLLRDGPDRLSQITAAWALGEIGAEEAVQRLAYSLLIEDFNLQDAAQAALFKILGKVDVDVYRARATVALERWEKVVKYGRAATEPLVRAAGSRERTVQSVRIRCAAARALGILGKMGDERVIPALLDMVDDSLPAPRRAAAAALAGLGDAEVAAKLVKLLDSHDPTLRAAGLRALGTLGDPGSVQQVHTIGQGDEEPEIRLAAVEALQGFGAHALEGLTDFLSGDNELDLRLAAVDSLARLGTPLAADALIVALGDSAAAVRFAAREGLKAYAWEPIGLRRHRTDAGYQRWTGRSEWTTSAEPVEQSEVLLKGLDHADPTMRRAAAEGLADLKVAAAVKPLTKAIKGADVDVAVVAAQALVDLGEAPGEGKEWIPYHTARLDEARVLAAGAKAVPTLASQIVSLDPDVRARCAELLGAIGAKDCVPVLMTALPDLDEEVIDVVLTALERVGLADFESFYGKRRKKAEQQELTAALIPVAAHPRPAVRLWALRALAAVDHDDCVPVLVSALADTAVPVACVAARALGKRKAVEHVELLLALLRSTGSSDLRQALLEGLGAMGDSRATEALALFLRYPDPALQKTAEAALKALLGKKEYDRASLEALADLVAEKWEALVTIGEPALAHLTAVLSDRESTPLQNARRYHAALVMGRIGGAKIPALLSAEINDPSPQVRQGVIEGLAAAGDPSAAEAIRLRLGDAHSGVREAAVRALGALHAIETSEEVGQLYHDDSDAVRQACVAVLGTFDSPAILPIVEILEGGDVASKCRAAQALAEVGDPAAIRYLEFSLGDSDYAVRKASQEAMIALGWTPVGVRSSVVSDKPARWSKREEWVEGDAKTSQPEALLAAMASEVPLRRRVAAETLGDLRHEPAADALRKLAESDPDIETRMVACKALVDLGQEPSSSDPLWAPYYALVHDWAACRDLGAAAVQPLLRMMRSTRANVRLQVAEVLGEAGDAVALPVLGDLLYDPSPLLRAKGAEAMARIGGEAASTALLQAFGAEGDPSQRLNLLRAALMLGDKLAIRLVQAAEHDPAPMVRTVAEEYQATRALFGAGE